MHLAAGVSWVVLKEFVMQRRFVPSVFLALAALIVVNLCLIEAGAQTRKKRRSRRAKPAATRPVITNPTIAPAGTEESGDAKIISTADESSAGSDRSETTSETKAATKKKGQSDPEEMQRTINTLSNQVDKLSDTLTKMQENDRTLLDMERLTRAEQRAENLRTQQLDTETKLADLQARLEQIEYAIKPENIERETAGYGSTHPEETRAARRRQLEGERSRLQAQVKLLETNRARLEAAVASADAEVDLLRRRLESQQQQQQNNVQDQTDQPAKNPKKP